MIPKNRRTGPPPAADAPQPPSTAAERRPAAVNAGEIARKPRQVALALQRLYGI